MYSCFNWNKRRQNPFSVVVWQVKHFTCKANPAKMTSPFATPPWLLAMQHMAACAVEGDFRRERPCHFLGALTSKEESLSVRYHKQTCDMPLWCCPREYIKNTQQTSSELLEQREITLALDGATALAANLPLPVPALLCVSADLCWQP